MGLSSVIPKGKKGIFFTLIAVSLLGIILFSYTVTYSYSLQEKSSLVETRVETMNRFLQSVDDDMENAIYISGYRSIVGLTDYVTSNGTYVADAPTSLEELFINGTVDGYDSIMMVNNTFLHWMDKMDQKGDEIGVDISVGVTDINIFQTSPWSVRFSVDSVVNLSDQKSTANWSKQKSLYSDISLIGFEDPAYALHTSGMIYKRVNTSVYDGNFSPENDTSNLLLHVANTYYVEFNASPSFLMRFEDDYGPHEFGIESLVNKTEIMNYCSVSTSSVDYICWSQNSTISTFRVDGFNGTDFRIDNETNDVGLTRIERYGLEDVIY